MPSDEARTEQARGTTPPSLLWWALAALVSALGAWMVFPTVVGLVVALGTIVVSVVVIVLTLRAKGQPRPSRRASLLGVLVVAMALVAVGTAVVGCVMDRTATRVVLVEASGPAPLTVDYESAGDKRSETWASGDRREFVATGSETTMTVTAQDGSRQRVGCEIRIDGEVVVAETSESGTVTCRYRHPWA